MCGRFTNHLTWQEIIDLCGLAATTVPLNMQPRYNIAPTQPALVAFRNQNSNDTRNIRGNDATFMRWGLVPGWSKGPDARFSMINARTDTIDTKPAYRGAFRHRRALIPANGFYEWQKQTKGAKQPYYICLKDQKSFAFAGLWENWLGPDGSELLSFTIITTEPNEKVAPIHDRMPVILPPDLYGPWLDPETPRREALQMLKPCNPDDMDLWPVSHRVNSPATDDRNLIQREDNPAGTLL